MLCGFLCNPRVSCNEFLSLSVTQGDFGPVFWFLERQVFAAPEAWVGYFRKGGSMRINNNKAMGVALAALVSGFCLVASAASAQNAVAPSGTTKEDIICKLSDTCDVADANNQDGRIAKPEERVFSLQKSSTQKPDERQFKLQKQIQAAPVKAPVVAKSKSAAKAPAPSGGNSTARFSLAPKNLEMKVQFLLGSSQLTKSAEEELDVYAKALQSTQLAGMNFIIEGHTDATGARSRNIALSQGRAQSVVDYLVAAGVSKDRLTAQGLGPDRPLPGYSKRSPVNRRVELLRAN